MGKLNMKKIQEKSEDLKRKRLAEFDSLKTGKNVRRILPPKGDKDVFWSEGYVHFGLGKDGKNHVTCLDTWDDNKERCPVCAYIEGLEKSSSSADKKLANRIRKTKCYYLAVMNRDEDDETPLILRAGQTIMKAILDIICDPDYGDITDFEEGRDITINKDGNGMDTKYSVIPKGKESLVSKNMTPEELDEALPDLDALFVRRSADEIQRILNGVEDSDKSEDDDEDEGGQYDDMDVDDLVALCKKRKISLPPKPNKLKLISLLEKYDLETEDEDEEDEEDEDEEDEEDEDEDNEDEDNEDEDNEDEDAIQAEIMAELKNRKKGGK